MMHHTHTANWFYYNGNLWDLRTYYVQKNYKSQTIIDFFDLVWTFLFVLYKIPNIAGVV